MVSQSHPSQPDRHICGQLVLLQLQCAASTSHILKPPWFCWHVLLRLELLRPSCMGIGPEWRLKHPVSVSGIRQSLSLNREAAQQDLAWHSLSVEDLLGQALAIVLRSQCKSDSQAPTVPCLSEDRKTVGICSTWYDDYMQLMNSARQKLLPGSSP